MPKVTNHAKGAIQLPSAARERDGAGRVTVPPGETVDVELAYWQQDCRGKATVEQWIDAGKLSVVEPPSPGAGASNSQQPGSDEQSAGADNVHPDDGGASAYGELDELDREQLKDLAAELGVDDRVDMRLGEDKLREQLREVVREQ